MVHDNGITPDTFPIADFFSRFAFELQIVHFIIQFFTITSTRQVKKKEICRSLNGLLGGFSVLKNASASFVVVNVCLLPTGYRQKRVIRQFVGAKFARQHTRRE